MQRVLVTGAAGGIGSRLRKLLKGVYPEIRWSDLKTPHDLAPDEQFVQADLASMSDAQCNNGLSSSSTQSSSIPLCPDCDDGADCSQLSVTARSKHSQRCCARCWSSSKAHTLTRTPCVSAVGVLNVLFTAEQLCRKSRGSSGPP